MLQRSVENKRNRFRIISNFGGINELNSVILGYTSYDNIDWGA